MQNFFVGFLLIFLNLRLTFDSVIINCIPNFIGYYFLIKGINEFSHQSKDLQKAKPIATVLLFYEILNFLLDLSGYSTSVSANFAAGVFSVGFVVTIITLYCSYLIVSGIKQIYPCADSEQLYSVWKAIAIVEVLSYVFIYIIPGISLLGIILLVAINILFLVIMNRIRKNYSVH
jgi:uncharacterized membrane protein HdeD (DUF308 family)